MAFLGEVGSTIVGAYTGFLGTLPFWAQNFVNLFFIALVVLLYSILIYNFYRFVARKNIISLNLKKYNRSEHPVMAKTLAAMFYTIEYIIILPFMTMLWFAVFTIFLIFLTDGIELNTLLIISAVIIVATRMAAYYKEDLSKDMAKLLPFTLLGAAITKVNGFSFEKILTQLFAIPSLMSHIASYLFFIFIIELVLRFLETTFVASGMHEEVEEPEE